MGSKTTTTNSNQTATANTNAMNASQSNSANASQFANQSNNTVGASGAAQPFINTALGDLGSARDLSTGFLGNNADGIQSLLGGITSGAQSSNTALDSALARAQSFADGNGLDDPYFQQNLASAGRYANDQAMAGASNRGIAGGSEAAGLIARTISDAQAPVLSANWHDKLAARIQAASMIPNLVNARSGVTSGALGNLMTAIGLPYAAVGPYASGVQGLTGNWLTNQGSNTGSASGTGSSSDYGASIGHTDGTQTGTSTSKESGGLLGSILGGIASLGSAWISR